MNPIASILKAIRITDPVVDLIHLALKGKELVEEVRKPDGTVDLKPLGEWFTEGVALLGDPINWGNHPQLAEEFTRRLRMYATNGVRAYGTHERYTDEDFHRFKVFIAENIRNCTNESREKLSSAKVVSWAIGVMQCDDRTFDNMVLKHKQHISSRMATSVGFFANDAIENDNDREILDELNARRVARGLRPIR